MSCDHMYVTGADKALNMCGLCGVTFDEWREGKVSTFKDGVMAERERILAMKKDIINCVIDYGLTPEKYERICNDIDALIKGEK